MKRSPTFLLTSLLLFAGASSLPAGGNATNALPACCAKAEAPTAPLSDRSLYQTESSWTTDTGRPIALADLKGRPQVIALFSTSCQSACPLIVNDMMRIEAALKPELRGRVGFTLVTFDTQRDTPEALAAYRATRNLSPRTWTLLRGQPDDVRELAVLLGVKYKEQADRQFVHSNVITVLNAGGEIVRQQIGLGQDIGPIVRELETLVGKGP